MTAVINHTLIVDSHVIVWLFEHITLFVSIDSEDSEHRVISIYDRFAIVVKFPPVNGLADLILFNFLIADFLSDSLLECNFRSINSILARSLWISLPESNFAPGVTPATIAEAFEATAGRKLGVMIPPTLGIVVDTEHGLHVVIVTHRVNVLPVLVQDEAISTIVGDDILSQLSSELIVFCSLIERITCH